MGIGSIIGGVASIGGALLGSNATKKAANTQANAADQASQVTWDMFNQQREDQEPWRAVGGAAINRLAGLAGIGDPTGQAGYGSLTRPFTMADYQADPGYQFRLDQGQQALERSAAARGGLLSGAAMKDLNAFAQGTASQEYGNAYNRFNNDQSTTWNRLAGLAGVGQQANTTVAQLGSNAAQQVSNNIIGAGNAAAAGQVGAANAWQGAIGQGISGYQNNQLLQLLANK